MGVLWELLAEKKLNTGWHVEIIDEDLVDNKYKKPDYLKIHQAISQGLREAPGMRIYQEEKPYANDPVPRSPLSQT